jgi:hypothetical protein
VGYRANIDALEERKIPCPCRDSKPGSPPACSLITIPTRIVTCMTWLLYVKIHYHHLPRTKSEKVLCYRSQVTTDCTVLLTSLSRESSYCLLTQVAAVCSILCHLKNKDVP